MQDVYFTLRGFAYVLQRMQTAHWPARCGTDDAHDSALVGITTKMAAELLCPVLDQSGCDLHLNMLMVTLPAPDGRPSTHLTCNVVR